MLFLNAINAVIKFFSGKKTYIIGVLLVILGILQQNTEVILEGLAILFLRAGVSKAGK